MIKIEQIDQVADKISKLVPETVKDADFSLKQKVKALLQDFAGELDLVTREEFDVQRKVLLKTRMKLEALEARLTEITSE